MSLPSVTIVMPVRNEAAFIKRSLDCVLSQDYPPELLEIIVADGMSTDDTRNIIRRLHMRYPRVEIVDNPEKIAPTGLNRALERARGEIIVRIDGHCEIARDYITKCVQRLLHDGVDGVGGPIETIGETPLSRTIALAMSSRFGVGGSAFRTVRGKAMLVDTVAFPAYTRRAIELAGPFDEELVRNQDDEYNYRLRALGCKVLLAPEVSSRYYSRSSLRSLWRQYFQYGFWKVRVMQKHPRQMSLRQFVPPLFITLLLIPVLATLFVPPALLLSIAVLCAYVVANVLASLLTARGKAKEHLIALPVVFAVLHFSYGLGFLVGLVRFWNCWRFENPAQGNIRSFASNEEGNTAKRGQPETEVSR